MHIFPLNMTMLSKAVKFSLCLNFQLSVLQNISISGILHLKALDITHGMHGLYLAYQVLSFNFQSSGICIGINLKSG